LTGTRFRNRCHYLPGTRMKKDSHFARFMQTHYSRVLAGVLVADMAVSPVADFHPHVGALLAGLIWLVIIAAAHYMAGRRVVRWAILPIAALWAIARLLEAFASPAHFYARMAPPMGLALSCALLWGILERSTRASRSPGSAIAESFIAYLLIAIAFGQLYWILNQYIAKPFNQPISPHQISTMLYFSMVTISTVGYGGIAPVDPYVRMVAAFESITGIFYIAVVVARLVSTYDVLRRSPPQ
jgi:Ion channel